MATLSREQRGNIDRVLRVGRKVVKDPKKRKKLFKAAIMVGGTENRWLDSGGGDRDSTGYFQQRPSQGWGPASESLETDAGQFFRAALRAYKPGMSSAKLSQAVQRSAFPGRYAEHGDTAEGVLRKSGTGGGGGGFKKLGVKVGMRNVFDEQGFERAQRQAIVGNLIARRRGTGGVLFKTGLLTTQMPNREDFAEQRLISKVVSKGTVGGKSVGGAPSKVREMKKIADAVDKRSPSYLWGGGHGGSPAPIGARVDCSGFVSQVLGVSPRVSGQFARYGQAGKGRHVTIYANSGHVLIQIGKDFYATSRSNPGGGAGKIPHPDSAYLSRFTARHPKGL